MKNLLLSQLGQEIVAKESFKMGYFQGTKRVWVRNEDDIQEVVKLLRSKDNHCVTLRCMCKSQASKRVLELSDSESDEEAVIKSKSKQRKKCSKYTEKLEQIDDTVDELKCKHGSAYNAIQYRVWAETIDAGHHDSLEKPPKGSFFKSQGRKGNSRASTPPASSASNASVTQQATLTPGKVANLRSTYIQQIKELHSLLEIGAITEEHHMKQRDTLLQQMDKLN